ncbi:MAG: bifunctional acetate--CoA ligase family protein/GNAT family N-acetyltransferase [Nitrospirae bacterium]|nr:bifunctional acetate--CoA ligase family protein/GNAT family N-acetyltransferase [Nitrospirota bacterium]
MFVKKLFSPDTVAVIGATERDGSVGRTVLENLVRSPGRRVFPVNPKRKEVLGIECFASVSDIPVIVDLAVIVTPASTVPAIVEECGKAGIEGVIIISAGFRESGEEGRGLEDEIRKIRRRYGMRIVGPNCLGVIRPHIDLNASFLKVNPKPGKIAFISQSGALGSAILDWAMESHVGFSMFASLGSMVDVDFGDIIDFVGDDPNTRSIMLYIEGIGNAKKFMSAARGFARSKPIIVIKPGKFAESARAAVSHTGAMAGDYHVYDAAFKRAGVIRIEEIADLFNAAEVLDSKYLPKGPKLAIITNAGGVGVIATDALMQSHGELSKISDEGIKELDQHMPAHWSRGNPIDILGDADIDRYLHAIKVCLNEDEVNGILVIYTPQGAAKPDELAQRIVDIAKKTYKPIIAVWMGGKMAKEGRSVFLKNNIPTTGTPEHAVKTYMYMYKYGKNLQLLYETPAELSVDQAPPKHHLKALIRRSVQEGRLLLNEDESKKLLKDYGIPVTRAYTAGSIDEALSIAGETGYPVVLKIVSPDITHKTDVGGVITGVNSEDQLREKYNRLISSVRENRPEARISGVSVQKMFERIDYELILGAKKDREFGTVILFGMGGIGVEIFRDFSVALPPLNQTLARRLMEETEVFKMIQGYRGRPPADIRQLEQIIVAFSNLIIDFPEIEEMDINPLAISGSSISALDARTIIDKDAIGSASPYQHLVITPYPTRYVIPWKLMDGTEVLLRPIRPEDEPMESEMLSTLSEQALVGRFFQAVRKISHDMLTRYCNIDYDREMAIVAELREDGRKRLIGIGRIIIETDFRKGEFAVLVHDDFQRRGLGYKLVDMLIGIAHEKGLEKVYGIVLTDNRQMLRICRELGFTVRDMPDGLSKVELMLK